MPIEYASFSLFRTVEAALEVVAFESEKKGLELIYKVEPRVPDIIMGDATRLRQVLINLLGNAVKFSYSGDIIISITTEQKEERKWDILFSVEDHGTLLDSALLYIIYFLLLQELVFQIMPN
jgi:signal transduction histidine kinase